MFSKEGRKYGRKDGNRKEKGRMKGKEESMEVRSQRRTDGWTRIQRGDSGKRGRRDESCGIDSSRVPPAWL